MTRAPATAAVDLEALAPAEAIAFFRGKGLQESFDHRDVWKEEHARAFTVAKAMRRDVLLDLRGGIDDALAEGRTFAQFRDELKPLLAAKGWWGRSTMTDPKSGEAREVQLGSVRRLRTIFNVNLRSSYAAGRWQRIQETKAALPFLRYSAVQDGRQRPEHDAWHGTVLPVDDPWWDTHYPPCDYGCRCTPDQVSQRTLDARGWSVTEDPVRFAQTPHVNPRTGEVAVLERGIGPGFDFNIGKAWLDGVTPRAAADLPGAAAVARGAVAAIAARAGPAPLAAGVTTEEAAAAFTSRLGFAPGAAGLFTDAGGDPFPVSPALFKTASGAPRRLTAAARRGLPLAAEAIAAPDEIRWIWTEGERAQLVRRYVRRVAQPGGKVVEVVVDAVAGGAGPWWSWRTSLDGPLDLTAYRSGVLAWAHRPGGDN